ncbi:MAG: M55 family metallopeptidase, partial [Halanaerobiales bacterium]
ARINGQSISEAGINGRLAGYFGVPAVFISGDQCAVECAKEELNNPVGVVVKHTIGRTCAELYPFKKVKYKINDGVARAMEKISSYKPVLEEGSKELEIDFVKTSMAEMASLIPGVKRINGRTIVYSTEDFLELYKVFMAAIVMASKSN